ncbi:MAG: hypothetical protein F4X16_08865 [Caldilineaceae bacterium SB0661_bin_34]|nr:hypothetical protein [Caldilineaceae bacterium SB0661_bin_34]
MSNPFPAVNEGAISDWVGSRSFQRGRSYFKRGDILEPRLQDNTLKAWCQGSRPQPYRLWVACGTEGIKEADCSCPVGGGGRCKHVAALLLTWLDDPDSFREVEELDPNLERRSQSELIALIKQMVEAHPTFEALLEAPPPEDGQSSPLVDPESYRRQAELAIRSGVDGWDWGGVGDINVVLGSGDNFLAKSDYANAGIVYLAVAQEMFEHFEMVYDEDGEEMHEVVNRCIQGLGNCLTAEDGNAAARENALQALFEIFRLDLNYGGYGMGDEAEGLILEHADDDEKRVVAGWARTAMQAATGEYDSFRRRSYGSILLDLEADHLDDDAFLEICRESGLLDDLVDRLLTLGRLDEALAEAGRAGDMELLTLAGLFGAHGHGRRLEPLVAERIETTRIDGLIAWLKEQHEERGELDEALVLAQQLLEQRQDLAAYQDVRELSQRLGIWQATRPELLAEWAAARQYGLLTDIHLDEGEIDLALKSVRQPSQGFYYGQWMRVAEAAAETRPQAAAELYREQAEKLVEARGRERYQQACTYLTTMRDLYRQMSQEPAWTDFMAEFRERHHRLRALQDELSKAGL